jgi:hypothetical protein
VAVETADAPFLDRSAVESLFGLRRRQALKLVHALGGYRVGNVLLAPRDSVLHFLDATSRGKLYRAERVRRERILESIEEAKREIDARKVKLKVPTGTAAKRTVAELPEGIRLSPTELRVTFSGAQDLLQKLYELSKAIAADFARFESLMRGDSPEQGSVPSEPNPSTPGPPRNEQNHL